MNGNAAFLKNAALLAGIVVGIVTVLLPLYTRDSPVPNQVQENSDNATVAKDKADSALVTANSALNLAIEASLTKEKVCSLSHQGGPCKALFNRLARSINDVQRKRLACTVLSALDPAQTAALRKASRCPRNRG